MPLQEIEAASISKISEILERLKTLRGELCSDRAGVQYQFELLSNDFSEALTELLEVIETLPANFDDQNKDKYKSLIEWHETLSQRAQAINQAEGYIRPRENELNKADADFVAAAERLADQPFIASDSVRQPYPLLLEMFNSRQSTCQILAEKLAVLQWEHEEDLLLREIQRDQDEEIDMADDDFQLLYISARAPLEAELVQAQQERSALKAGCLAQGFDMTGQRYINLAELSPSASDQEDEYPLPPALEALDSFPTQPLAGIYEDGEDSLQHSGSSGNHMEVGDVAGWLDNLQQTATMSDMQHRRSRSGPAAGEVADRLEQQNERRRPRSQ